MEPSKTSQTRWEWHHNTFTPSLHLVPFCELMHTKKTLHALSLFTPTKWTRDSALLTQQHRKSSPLIRIDGDAVQLQRTEYGRCQMDVELHGVRLAVREHEYLLNGSFTVSVFSCLHWTVPHTVSASLHERMRRYMNQFIFWRTKFQKFSCLVAFALWWSLTCPLCGTVGSSSLWDTTWVHRFVVFWGGSLLVKFCHGWSPKPGPFRSSARRYWKQSTLWDGKGLACESKPWHPRCPICDQVAHCLTLSVCLCATQNVSSFGSSRSVKLSHLLSGEPQCVWLYLLYVVVSLCLCKKKMSNPSTTTCQDATHFFLSGGILCVCGYTSCVHLGPYVLFTMSHIPRQQPVKMSHLSDVKSFVRWPIVFVTVFLLCVIGSLC